MANISRETIERIVKALQEHYFREQPAPKYVQVDPKSVRVDKGDSDAFCAKVTIEVDTATGPKRHTVHIRFKGDAKGRVIPESISYL